MQFILRGMLRTPKEGRSPVSTFRRYLVVQLFVFVCGIVGPMFLIMFFASAPNPQLRWAFWWGLIITYIDIMIALGITAAGRDRGPQRVVTNNQVPQKVR